MWRRVAGVVGLALFLAACKPAAPTARSPAPAAEPPAAAAPVHIFKAKASPTLAAIRKRGWLSCGVNPGLAGFAYPDNKGDWTGFDVDICRAVAAATLGDAKAVRFTPVTAEERLAALANGKIDILSRNTSWTFGRDAGMGVDFPAVTYFDGQGFLAPKALKLTSVGELGGARICVQAGTASQENLADFFRSRGLKYREVLVANDAQARERYQNDGCDAFTADVSALASSRSVMNSPNAHIILPEVISKEPLGPVVRQDDSTWADIVRWTVYATLLAEELKVSSRNAADLRSSSQDIRVRRLLGTEGGFGSMLGLKDDWAFQAITQVGAYDEIFRRNIGEDSALKLGRGLNALWNAPQPGLMYPPPIR
ncbi:MAG TPA: amino acid ABC transporter substrate-binding protein [Phenylobacterium sp.]|nr:amino acid ABC transporter substrate-binding protein [Phenylobacterium sp.]